MSGKITVINLKKNNNKSLQTVPEVGKEYHIFDDGKIRLTRHYICKIVDIIPFKDCKDKKLIKAWKSIIEEDKQILGFFAEETDYFIKGISSFDKNPLYFVRTDSGGWFSIDYPNWWMGAELDITGKLYETMIKEQRENK